MPDNFELHRGWADSFFPKKVQPGKPEDWNTDDDIPDTHFDGPTEKELTEAAKRADAVHAPQHYCRGGVECIEAIRAGCRISRRPKCISAGSSTRRARHESRNS